jgi:hypothetical protein
MVVVGIMFLRRYCSWVWFGIWLIHILVKHGAILIMRSLSIYLLFLKLTLFYERDGNLRAVLVLLFATTRVFWSIC